MLDALLIALATTAGSRLVTAMVDDGWAEIRVKFAALLGRGDPAEEERQAARLERARDEVVAAARDGDPEAVTRQQERQTAVWSTRFEDALDADPDLAPRLRSLLEQLPGGSTVSAGSVQVAASASGQAQQAVQGQGVQTNTFGLPARPAD